MTSTLILALESTCDETAAAVVADGKQVLSNVVASQIDLHAKFRGVVPEIASRAHVQKINALIAEALAQAGIEGHGLSAIAVTNRPGLIGCLIVSVTAAKSLAWVWGKPLIAVDHIQAHATSAGLEHDVPYPAVSLVVSGGHTALYHVRDPLHIERLGATIDDAVGEAYDKVAATLGLGYPGGPILDQMATAHHPLPLTHRVPHFPRSLLSPESLDFSFSGLKTAVLYHVHGPSKFEGGLEKLTPADIAAIAVEFQAAVVDVLTEKVRRAAERCRPRSLLLGGGVACNRGLRAGLSHLAQKLQLPLFLPNPTYCTDNAAMSAALAHHLLLAGKTAPLDLEAYASGTF